MTASAPGTRRSTHKNIFLVISTVMILKRYDFLVCLICQALHYHRITNKCTAAVIITTIQTEWFCRTYNQKYVFIVNVHLPPPHECEDRTWSYHLSAYESQKHRLQVVGHYKKHHYTPLRSRGPLMRSRVKEWHGYSIHTLQLHGQGFCGAYTIRIRAERLQKPIVLLSCFPAQISKHV